MILPPIEKVVRVAKDKLGNGKPAVQLTVKGIAVWGGLIVFVMGWMFVLGILVGRGTAPVVTLDTHLLEKELAELKAEKLEQEEEKIRQQSQNVVEKLPFYEKLKEDPEKIQARQKTEALPVAEPTPKPAVEPARPAPTPKPTAEPAKPTPKPAAEPAKPKPKPTAEPAKPAPTPQPAKQEIKVKPAPATEPTAAKGRYTVQVASFKAQESADKLVATLKSKGYAAYHVRTTVPDLGNLYRVRVGTFAGRSDAESMLKKLGSDRVKGMVVSTQ